VVTRYAAEIRAVPRSLTAQDNVLALRDIAGESVRIAGA
jgi:hypothetical protein